MEKCISKKNIKIVWLIRASTFFANAIHYENHVYKALKETIGSWSACDVTDMRNMLSFFFGKATPGHLFLAMAQDSEKCGSALWTEAGFMWMGNIALPIGFAVV